MAAGDGFGNPILGAAGTLIRNAIKSINYVAGVAGWQIKQDGTAEFNNLTARGTISANGGLITLDANGVSVDDADGSYVQLADVPGVGAVLYLNPKDPGGGVLFNSAELYSNQEPAGTRPLLSINSPNVTNPASHPNAFVDIYGEGPTGDPSLIELGSAYIRISGKTNFTIPCGKVILGALTFSIPSGTITAVDMKTEIRDFFNFHSNVTNPSRVTPTVAGVYRVRGCAMFAANATGSRRAYIGKNGSVQGPISNRINFTANQISVDVEDQVFCNGTTDYFSLHVFQDSGVALNVVGDTTEATTFNTGLTWEYISDQ
jgi:hypothetical protein